VIYKDQVPQVLEFGLAGEVSRPIKMCVTENMVSFFRINLEGLERKYLFYI
jgi:hypothetical protein